LEGRLATATSQKTEPKRGACSGPSACAYCGDDREKELLEAIVLAGGLGTRLRVLVPDVPKPMAPVAGRPFLEILLCQLERKGFTRIVLSVGYLAEQIVNHFGSQFQSLSLSYVQEQQPLGTGGATRLALTHCLGDHAFVFNGDTFLDLEVASVEAMWQSHRRPIIVAREVEDTTKFGRLLVERDQVMGFTEKGISGPGLINAGCYVLGSHQLDSFSLNQPFSIECDYFQKATLYSHVDMFLTRGMFIDIGVPEEYGRAKGLFAGQT
jgi:D-glycero-alpha-D-manno-heptose 1-phosphate guanylyltransferase